MSSHHAHIGKMIKLMRSSRGLSQVRLAGQLGVTQQYVAKIESGKQAISIDQLARVAAILKCYLDVKLTPEESDLI